MQRRMGNREQRQDSSRKGRTNKVWHRSKILMCLLRKAKAARYHLVVVHVEVARLLGHQSGDIGIKSVHSDADA